MAKAIALLIAWTALALGAAPAVAHGGHARTGIAPDASLAAHGRPLNASNIVDTRVYARMRSPSLAAAPLDVGDRVAERAGEPSTAAVPGCPGHDGAPCCCTSDRWLRTTQPRAFHVASIGEAMTFDASPPTFENRGADDAAPQAPRIGSGGARGPPATT